MVSVVFLDGTKNEPLHQIIYSALVVRVYLIFRRMGAGEKAFHSGNDDDDCRALFGFVCKLNFLTERANFL